MKSCLIPHNLFYVTKIIIAKYIHLILYISILILINILKLIQKNNLLLVYLIISPVINFGLMAITDGKNIY